VDYTLSSLSVIYIKYLHGIKINKCIEVDSVLGLLHRVDVDDFYYVSEVNATSIFRVEVCRLLSFLYAYIAFCFEKRRGGGGNRVGFGASPGPVGTVDKVSCAAGPFKGTGVIKISLAAYVLESSAGITLTLMYSHTH
jgi:hypothetical protein